MSLSTLPCGERAVDVWTVEAEGASVTLVDASDAESVVVSTVTVGPVESTVPGVGVAELKGSPVGELELTVEAFTRSVAAWTKRPHKIT